MLAEAREFVPALATVGGTEQSGILDPGINGVRRVERGLEVPDALEFPRAGVPSYH
jgi:hypothetical protein